MDMIDDFGIRYFWEEKAADVAKQRGLIVKYPEINQIFLDIDTVEQIAVFQKRMDDLTYVQIGNSLFDNIESEITESSSGNPHYHIVLSFTKNGRRINLNDWQRVALQFMFGSDPIRETLTIYRILNGIENPSLLFEKE